MYTAREQSESVIILAGTKWQVPLIQRLKEKGHRVIVFNLFPDSPAFPYADEYCIVDITDKENAFNWRLNMRRKQLCRTNAI